MLIIQKTDESKIILVTLFSYHLSILSLHLTYTITLQKIQIGDTLPLIVSVVAILMGLNLLEVITFQLPSLDVDVRKLNLPPAAQAYLAGLTFALAASPCSTPVLATLLAYVSTSKDPVAGAGLLLAYAVGYVAPLLAAALFTGALKDILAMRQWSGWITPVSGVLLLAGGTYSLLFRLVP